MLGIASKLSRDAKLLLVPVVCALGVVGTPRESFALEPAGPPAVTDEGVSRVTADSALLEGRVNPNGRPTTYTIEYGLSTAYGTIATAPGATLSGTVEPSDVTGRVTMLASGTTYHYRVVAASDMGVATGTDRTFTTQSSDAGLPDGRVWEQVSPVNKHGGLVDPINQGVVEASLDGAALTYRTTGPIVSGPPGNEQTDSQVLSKRAANDWESEDISPSHEAVTGAGGLGGQYRMFSEDLQSAGVEPLGDSPLSAAASEQTIYRRQSVECSPAAAACYEPLVTGAAGHANVPFGTSFGGTVKFITGTADMSHIVFSSEAALDPAFPAAGGLYLWNAGHIELASILPGGTPASNAALGYRSHVVRNAISPDGTRIVWSAEIVSGDVVEHHLYLRDLARHETIQLDLGAASPVEAEDEAQFQTASGDGVRIFFTDGARLTPDATAAGPASPDLYACDVAVTGNHLSCTPRDLTPDSNAGEAASVRGAVIGASNDGSTVYFVANGTLTGDATPGACKEAKHEGSTPGATCNLYVWQNGTTRLVAVLSNMDDSDWEALEGDLGLTSARISPDGRYVAFMSAQSLTHYDNRDAVSGEPDEEVYLYDSQQARLTCASCNPTGSRPFGLLESSAARPLFDQPGVWNEHWVAAELPGWTPVDGGHALYQSRYLASSGRLFFTSVDPLVGADRNATSDVYQYEPPGIGSCNATGGCVALLSGGQSENGAALLDASETGADVFILTDSPLSASDTDTAFDVYDARECQPGVSCGPSASSPAPPCGASDTCRPVVSQVSLIASFSSDGSRSNGNVGPQIGPKPVPTRAQRLRQALRRCQKMRNMRRRAHCTTRARRRFGMRATRAGRASLEAVVNHAHGTGR